MEYVDPRCVYRILILSAVLSAWAHVEAAKATPPVERIAGSCLNAGSKVTIKCPSANQNIDIISVAYAHTPNGDCNNPLADNDCQGPSDILSLQAQAACNGANLCLLDVVTLQEFANLPGSTNDDLVQPSYSNCDVNNQLLSTGTTNTMQVKYECIEYEFCNAISDSVPDLTIATKGFPAKSVTNPSCSCDFESEDAEVFALTGYAHCNGTVIFVVEETGFDGTVSSLEYVCENKLQQDHILIGNKEPWKVSVTVDVEQSDEDSAYQISWYNIKPQGFARKKGGLIKVDCKAGRLWLPYRVKLILMIVLPIVSAIIIALIVIYCICKKRRRKAKRWRESHVRLSKAKKRQTEEEVVMDDYPVYNTSTRTPSVISFPNTKDERVDPEGNVDELGEYAAELKRKNEERRKKDLERRQGYQNQYNPRAMQYTLPLNPTPTPSTPTLTSATESPYGMRSTMQPNRRSQSIGNLRPSDRRYGYGENIDSVPDSKPLAYSKSASQSRASVRSLKRRAPQPSGPPQAPAPVHQNRTSPLYASASFNSDSVNRSRPRQGSTPALPSNPPPSYPYSRSQPRDNPYAAPYSARTPSSVSSPTHSDGPSGRSDDDDEETIVLRPTANRPKPAVAPKPHRSKYRSGRSQPGHISSQEMRQLRREMSTDSDQEST